MNKVASYFVIAPVGGLRMDFDYRIVPSHLLALFDGTYSAELYGCPPNYKPHPEICKKYRQPFEMLGNIPFFGYDLMIPDYILDVSTMDIWPELPNRTMKDYTCIGFQIDLDDKVNPFDKSEVASQQLFEHIVERGESYLDPLCFCLFKPGKDESIGRFGSVGNGIQCFWIGCGTSQNDNNPGNARFIARKSLRYAINQEVMEVLEEDFGVIDADITFQGMCLSTFKYPINRNDPYGNMLWALKHFRQSRDIQPPEARFRHLASIAEGLAKVKEGERVKGNDLRDRVMKISTRGWKLYESINNSHPKMLRMGSRSLRLIDQRYKEMGWEDELTAIAIIKDLWSNVRNPLSHSMDTFQTLKRDTKKDIANMEKVIVTMVNGWYAAYEVEDLYEKPAHAILLDGGDETKGK